MTQAFDITATGDSWELSYHHYEPVEEPTREALCTLGNGFFATRAAVAEHDAGDVHYPGTYIAGIYNRLTSTVADRELEHESLVNAPNWLPLRWRINDGEWFSIDDVDIHEFEQALDLRRGQSRPSASTPAHVERRRPPAVVSRTYFVSVSVDQERHLEIDLV